MSIPFEQSFPSENSVSQLSNLRLPNHSSLHLWRFHPYTAALSNSADALELAENRDTETDTQLNVYLTPVPFSLPVISEDDCMAGLRTVVAEMVGRHGTQAGIGCVELLVVDFALALRNYSRKEKHAVVDREAPATSPSVTV